jgi:hypothetical protein
MTMRDELSTLHGDLRLMQRAHSLDISMTELWEQSIPCEVKHHGYDEARVSPEHDLVLLKEDGRIVTLIPETYNVTIDGNEFDEYLNDALETNNE